MNNIVGIRFSVYGQVHYCDAQKLELSLGELQEMEINFNSQTNLSNYLERIYNKTASLFLAAAKIGPIITEKESKYKDALESYGKNLGLTFQIADDALDYNSDLKLFGKNIGNDFFEGKVTLPIIFLYQKANKNEKLFLEKTFKKQKRSSQEFDEIQNLIKKYNSINLCFKRAEHFVNISYNALNIFNPSREKTVLQNLTSYSLERSF